MTLHTLLRSISDGLKDHGVQGGYEYCYQGDKHCDLVKRCPADKNRLRCPDYMDRWITWQVNGIWTDPVAWAQKAQGEITDWDPNPSMMMLYAMIFDLGGPELEGPELDFFRARLGEVLAAWEADGWLARFTQQALEREARNPTDATLTDIAEAVGSILALTDSITHKERQHDD